ncbi:MAG: hypothetical protein ACK56F_31295, partial [bacterium]
QFAEASPCVVDPVGGGDRLGAGDISPAGHLPTVTRRGVRVVHPLLLLGVRADLSLLSDLRLP